MALPATLAVARAKAHHGYSGARLDNGGPYSPACAKESFSESRETRRNLTRRQRPGDAGSCARSRDFLSVKKKNRWYYQWYYRDNLFIGFLKDYRPVED